MRPASSNNPSAAQTSIDKALEVCEALSLAPSGLPLTEVARALDLPRPSVHRLLAVLKRRGYVRQDEESQRYSLTLKMLDLSFRLLGRSELRLHAYPVLREYVLRGRPRTFVAVPADGEVTYVWAAGPDEAAMRTALRPADARALRGVLRRRVPGGQAPELPAAGRGRGPHGRGTGPGPDGFAGRARGAAVVLHVRPGV